MEVDHHPKTEHPQPGAGPVGHALFDDLVHILDRSVDHGLGEQIVLAQHLEHGVGGDLSVLHELLAQQIDHLAVHLFRFHVPVEAGVVDDIVGHVPHHGCLDRVVEFVTDEPRKQGLTGWRVAHGFTPSS